MLNTNAPLDRAFMRNQLRLVDTGLLVFYDPSTLPEAGSVTPVWHDQSGMGVHLRQVTQAAQPMIMTENGRKFLRFASGNYMTRSGFLSSEWLGPASQTRPFSITAMFRAASGQGTGLRYIVHGNSASVCSLALMSGIQSAGFVAGGSGLLGGKRLDDDQWHVVTIVAGPGTSGNALYIDGFLETSETALTSSGTNVLGALSVGGGGSGAAPLIGDIDTAIIHSRALSLLEVNELHQLLGARRGLSVAPPQQFPNFEDTTSSNGQNVRIWEPQQPVAGAPLVILCHRHTGTEQIAPGAAPNLYKAAMMLTSVGYRVAASRQHGNNWGSASGVDDLVDLFNLMNARQAVTKVVLIAESMGGLSATLAVATSSLPIVGVILCDAVTNLADAYEPASGFSNYRSGAIDSAYSLTVGTLSAASLVGDTSISSSVSYPSGTSIRIGVGTANAETVTTTGAPTGSGPYAIPVPALTKAHASGDTVSDFPAKTAGRDPNLRAASQFTGVPWRAYSSINDVTSVNAANNLNAFMTKVAAAPEAVRNDSIGGGHLAGYSLWAADAFATIKRWCNYPNN